MFNKVTSFTIDRKSVEVLDNELVKTASEMLLPDGHQYDPDFVYMKVRAVSAGEYWGCNKNADFFPEEELKKNYKTFFDAHVFKNHENKEVEKAIGDVLDATWNDDMKYVELFIRVDKRIAPTIARGFEKGFMTDVSMGCKIDHSICSICGNLAKTQSQYCDHIRHEKHKVRDDGKKVYEININPRFHDISAVLNGADRTAKMTGLFISGTKVAFHEEESLEKCASTLEDALFDDFFYENTTEYRPQKQASTDSFADSLSFFDKTASYNRVSKKASELEKVAEIKKRVKGNVLAVAKSRAELSEQDRVSDAVQEIRTGAMMRPLSEDSMNRFADGISGLSNTEEVMAEQVLTTALKMLSLAGVNLSPAEFVHIMRRVIGVQRPKVVRVCPEHMDRASMMRAYDNRVAGHRRVMHGTNLPTIFNILRAVSQQQLPVIEGRRASAPATIVMRKVASCQGIKRPEVAGLNLEDKVLKIASEIIEERSMHLPQLTKRAMAASEEMEKCAGFFKSAPKYSYANALDDHYNGRLSAKQSSALINDINKNYGTDMKTWSKDQISQAKSDFKNESFNLFTPTTINKEAVSKLCTTCGNAGPDVYEGFNNKFVKTSRQNKDAEYVKCSKKNGAFKHKERDVCGDYIKRDMEKEASIVDHYYDYLVDIKPEKIASEHVYEEIERQAYGVYQNLISDYIESREFNGDLYRFANEVGVDSQSMEKCAKNIAKSVNTGLGTFLYSKYQGVAAREGRPQSTINRTVGENPEAAAIGATLATKGALDNVPKAKENAKKVIRYIAKKADENIDIYLSDMEREVEEDILSDIDIFKDDVINERLASEYSKKKIDLIKTASIMYAQGRQDICDNLLSVEGLGYNSVNNFLQICEDTLYDELEKKASIGKIVSGVAKAGSKVIGKGKGVGAASTALVPSVAKPTALTGTVVNAAGTKPKSTFNPNAFETIAFKSQSTGNKGFTQGAKSAFGKAKDGFNNLSTKQKVGAGAMAVGTGIGINNGIQQKKKFNEMHDALTNQ